MQNAMKPIFCYCASAVGSCAACDDELPLEGFYPEFVSGSEGLVHGPLTASAVRWKGLRKEILLKR